MTRAEFRDLKNHFLKVLNLTETPRELIDAIEHIETELRIGRYREDANCRGEYNTLEFAKKMKNRGSK